MKRVTITLPADQMERLATLLADFASDLEDDGREGSPDAALIWKVQSIARKS